ncbi:MAG: hypothetical protein HQM16_17960 [Deltaproteobacteria bacterium]|nr:hypothetical protein [Deltaproteobacteria bacterium]
MSISSIGSPRSFNPSQMASKFSKKMIGDLDTNSDGSIDKSEFVDGSKSKGVSQVDTEKMFSSIDVNDDGKVTQSEIEVSMKKMGGSNGAPPSDAKPKGGAKKPDGEGGGSQDTSKVYDEKDLNKDGTVSLMEEMVYALTHSDESKSATNDQPNQSATYSQSGSISKGTGGRANSLDVYA